MGPGEQNDLRVRIADYLRAHHTMTIATNAAGEQTPHAAHVFYAVDDRLRLVFLSQPASLHGCHIGTEAQVAATVSEEYQEWEMIQGVQIWGRAKLLRGSARAAALALYLKRFPFVKGMMGGRIHSPKLGDIGVYRVEPIRAAFTDNTTGFFGRETLELVRE
jgi:uncharacterized protein YhbP (UPF0306 family)